MDFAALTILIVYQWNEGPGAIVGLMLALGIPWVLVGPILSVLADHVSKRSLLITCVLLRVVVVLAFIWAPNLYVLLPLVFIRGTLGSLIIPARMGVVRSVIPTDLLPSALTFCELSLRITQILAPAIGGLIMIWASVKIVFVVEAFCLLIAAVFFAMLPTLTESEPREIKSKLRFWAEFKEGIRHIFTVRVLAAANLLMGIGFFLVFLYDGLLALWTKDLQMSETYYGWIMSSIGLGTVLGAIGAGMFTGWRKHPLRMICTSAVLLGLINLLIGMGGLLYVQANSFVWMGVFLLFGVVGAAATVPFEFILQTETPSHMIGRVSGVAGAIQNASMIVAPSIGAGMAKWLGVGGVFALAGLFMTVLALIVLLVLNKIVKPRSAAQEEGLVHASEHQ